MRYLNEYRDPALARTLVRQILQTATRRWVLMEVCGGQTHTIVKQGLDELLAPAVEMIHGPGCPVCVTSLEQIDKALLLAARPDVLFTSFGDMLRVPGSECDLQQIRARGGDVRVGIYDVTGRRVRSLERLGAGPGEQVLVWDGRDGGGRQLAPGVYLARYQAGAAHGTRRLVKLN